MMKKICIVSVLIILLIGSIVGTVYAASAKVTIKSSVNECRKDEEVTFEVKLSNIDNEKGIIALGGTIVYDKNELEFKKISNAENWSTSYNSNNGKFVADRSDRTKESETVFNITFKAIAKEKNNVNVTLSGLEASGGDGVIKIPDASVSVDIKAAEQKPGNTTKPVNNTVNGGSENKVISNVPKTGKRMNTPIIMWLIFFVIVALILTYLRFSKSDK